MIGALLTVALALPTPCGQVSKAAATRCTDEFLQRSSNDVASYLDVSKDLQSRGYTDLAKRVLVQANIQFARSAEPYLQLGLLLLASKDFEAAAIAVGTAAQLDPGSSVYALQLGKVLLVWHHYSTANDYLQAIQPRFGSLPEFRYELAYAHYGLSRYEQALAETRQLLNEHPQLADGYYLLGNCYWALNDSASAIAGFREAIRLNASDANYFTALGTVQSNSGLADEAAKNLEEALRLDATNLDAQLELAVCDERRGELKRAALLLESFNRVDPSSARAHSLLARIYFKQGKTEQANQEAEAAKSLRERSAVHVQLEPR